MYMCSSILLVLIHSGPLGVCKIRSDKLAERCAAKNNRRNSTPRSYDHNYLKSLTLVLAPQPARYCSGNMSGDVMARSTATPVLARSISEISSCFFGPRPWHIEIRHRVKKTSTNSLFGFETLKLKFED